MRKMILATAAVLTASLLSVVTPVQAAGTGLEGETCVSTYEAPGATDQTGQMKETAQGIAFWYFAPGQPLQAVFHLSHGATMRAWGEYFIRGGDVAKLANITEFQAYGSLTEVRTSANEMSFIAPNGWSYTLHLQGSLWVGRAVPPKDYFNGVPSNLTARCFGVMATVQR